MVSGGGTGQSWSRVKRDYRNLDLLNLETTEDQRQETAQNRAEQKVDQRGWNSH